MPIYLPFNTPQLPFGLTDPPMQQENPQPWKNPGADPAVQQMNAVTPAFQDIWGVYDLAGQPVFDIDTCVDFKFGDSAKVSDFPVEQGAFASFNKVVHPYQPKVKLAVSGQPRVSALLSALYAAVRSTTIYNVFTPEIGYLGVTLEKYDYTRSGPKGRGMVTVELTLMQVIQVSAQYTTVKLPSPKKKSAADAKNNGKAQTSQPPNPLPIEQQNAAMAKNMGIDPSKLGVHS